ncbi:hypothetical protein HLK56_32765 [Streptomyces sp. G9]|uniref:hypothetical protein n=1 Tax=unclassified Streptomyces TaxID=2593676 RepID=UPI000BF06635|nr:MULTISPECIES: hypothetical protein [unclassified Streptomyces]MZG04322.1 hypothetical protein [Streptomyces sp. SID5614]
MFENMRASEAQIAERNERAVRVAEALASAGFVVQQNMDQETELQGAMVSVDPANDSRGGVFVQWNASSSLNESAAKNALGGGIDSPIFRHFSFVVEQMHATLIAILGSAGFDAVDADDDMNPYLIRVKP